MWFLHTADWHVGKTLFGRSRLDEQEQVCAEIVDIAKREPVDSRPAGGRDFRFASFVPRRAACWFATRWPRLPVPVWLR